MKKTLPPLIDAKSRLIGTDANEFEVLSRAETDKAREEAKRLKEKKGKGAKNGASLGSE